MDPQELRLSNWVLFSEGKEYIQITHLSTLDRKTYDLIESIPLTEEILLKCGFNLTVTENIYSLFTFKGITVELKKMKREYVTDVCFNGFKVRRIESLHDLQNLYFQLYREELEINLRD